MRRKLNGLVYFLRRGIFSALRNFCCGAALAILGNATRRGVKIGRGVFCEKRGWQAGRAALDRGYAILRTRTYKKERKTMAHPTTKQRLHVLKNILKYRHKMPAYYRAEARAIIRDIRKLESGAFDRAVAVQAARAKRSLAFRNV